MSGPKFEKTVPIAASSEIVWRAITDPVVVEGWHFVPPRKMELKEGGRIEFGTAEKLAISGTVAEVLPGKKLVHSFCFHGHENTENDGETRLTWILQPGENDHTLLTLIHDGFVVENQTFANVTGGWPFLLDGLVVAAEAIASGRQS